MASLITCLSDPFAPDGIFPPGKGGVKFPCVNSLDISPEQFQLLSEQIVAIATDFLKSLDSRAISPSEFPAKRPIVRLKVPLPDVNIHQQAIQQLGEVIQNSRAQNGRFFGYVLGSGETAPAAADLLCSVLNQNVTAWRSSPAAVTLEKDSG